MSNLPSAVQFGDQSITPIHRDNQLWLTGPQIADALGYKQPNQASKIYRRNKDEFTAGMTVRANLAPAGGMPVETRIFSPRGCHLIAMFARTERAKAFRQWVLDVLERIGQPEQPPALISKQEFVASMENNRVRSMTPIPAGGEVVTAETVPGYLKRHLPQYALVKRDELTALVGMARYRIEEVELHSLGITNELGQATDPKILAVMAKLPPEQRWQVVDELREMIRKRKARSTVQMDSV